MKCIGGAGTRPHLALHPKAINRYEVIDDPNEAQHYLFHGLRVHDSHPMATYHAYGVHFCTFCGACGKDRSHNLAKVCPPVPNKFGKQVLARIAKGLSPNHPPKGSGKGDLA